MPRLTPSSDLAHGHACVGEQPQRGVVGKLWEAYFSTATQGINFNHEEMAEHDSRIYGMLLRYLPANGWRASCPHSSEAPPPPAKPPAPVNLRATTVTQTIVTLTWEVPPGEEGNVQRYDIVRSDDEAQSWWVAATIPADRTTFAVTGLTPDYLYSFAIEAGNGYRETIGPWKAVRTSPAVYRLSGETDIVRNEHSGPFVARYTAPDLDAATLTFSLAGADAGRFEMSDGGRLSFRVAPDYESPADADRDNVYNVTVQAQDGSHAISLDVTVSVTNADEQGWVSLSSAQPQAGTLLAATLRDLDGRVSGVTWTWEASDDDSTWAAIASATAASYSPTAADVGRYLRVKAVYSDGHGVGKRAQATTSRTTGAGERPAPTIAVPGGGGGGGGGGGPTGPTPSEADFEWTVKRDLEALDGGHDSPTGAWSDGTTLWIAENGDGAADAIYAYDIESGERGEEREFELDEANRAPRGLWSDGQVIWVSDSGRNRLFAHNLASGERLPERDIALAERNRDARGIWSDEETMWVLDGGKDSLFAYDLATSELLGEYELVSTNGDPHGIWSDRVTVWVSDHGTKRLFAYRLPARPKGPAGEDAERQDLERIRYEEFPNTVLSRASNNSPRGIWSDGDFMYVADESDGKVYTYNMPDAIDARLGSLSLSGVEIGEFDPGRTQCEGTAGEGVTEPTVVAEAMQRRTKVVIGAPDADEEADGYQVALEGLTEITVTVTSADGSRTKIYRVTVQRPEVELVLTPTWTSIEWPGTDSVPIGDALPESDSAAVVVAVYRWDEVTEIWFAFFPGLGHVPGVNTLAHLETGQTYRIATSEPVTWAVTTR